MNENEFEALKSSEKHVKRARLANALTHDIYRLGGPAEASEALKNDVADLLDAESFETAHGIMDGAESMSDCPCMNCR